MKARSPDVANLVFPTSNNSSSLADLVQQEALCNFNNPLRYFGARSFKHLKVNIIILYWILLVIGNQWSRFNTGCLTIKWFSYDSSLWRRSRETNFALKLQNVSTLTFSSKKPLNLSIGILFFLLEQR